MTALRLPFESSQVRVAEPEPALIEAAGGPDGVLS